MSKNIKILAVSDEELIEGHEAVIGDEIDDEIDLLVNCGDLSPSYLEYLINRFFPKQSLMVYGNHDSVFFNGNDEPSSGYNLTYQGVYVLEEDTTSVLSQYENPISIAGFSGAMAYGERPFFFDENDAKKFVKKMKRKNFFNNFNIDIMMSHTPPQIDNKIESVDFFHSPSDELGKLLDFFSPKIWFYGHIHPRYTNSQLDFEIDGMHLINCVPYKIIEYDMDNQELVNISYRT